MSYFKGRHTDNNLFFPLYLLHYYSPLTSLYCKNHDNFHLNQLFHHPLDIHQREDLYVNVMTLFHIPILISFS